MDKTVQQFLQTNRISVLGIGKEDGAVHSATLHYAHTENPLNFFFMTEKDSLKCKTLLDGSERKASLVIGFSEEEFVTFQAEGIVKMMTEDMEHEKGLEAYLGKYPSREKRAINPQAALLIFVPTWWRYRDYKTNPLTEISINNQ